MKIGSKFSAVQNVRQGPQKQLKKDGTQDQIINSNPLYHDSNLATSINTVVRDIQLTKQQSNSSRQETLNISIDKFSNLNQQTFTPSLLVQKDNQQSQIVNTSNFDTSLGTSEMQLSNIATKLQTNFPFVLEQKELTIQSDKISNMASKTSETFSQGYIRQGAAVFKMLTSFRTRCVDLVRRKLMEENALNCHHVWWIVHFIITGILLWLYFVNRLYFTAGTLAIIEVLVGVFFRNEIVITILHMLFVLIPIGKRFFNRMLHCIGGIHTSAAANVIVWLIIFLIKEANNIATLITGSILLALVIIISITALPPVRTKYHNSFEYIHRFIGWTCLVFLIVLVIQLQLKAKNITIKEALKGVPVLLTLFTTVIIVLPWVLVAKTQVCWRQPSQLLTIATFQDVYFPYGRVSRISLNGLEWHAFAIALTDANENSHSLVIANAGDWTKNISERCANETLPSKIWVRKLKSIGFMYSIHAYRRVLIVCTGSGIAPALCYIQNPIPTTFSYVLWIAKKHRQTFGNQLMDIVEKTYPNYTLHDTSVAGRPSVDLVVDMFYKIKGEAVFVVSNKSFTDYIVNNLWKKAIPVYGALFDS